MSIDPQSSPVTRRYARVLTIAGSDSGGGAGIQADLKTFAALGCYGMSAITALTAQNTVGVQAIHAVPPAFLRQQIDAVLDDIGADAVKIGMLHVPEVVQVVASALQRHGLERVIVDPVMVATSGDRLIAEETVAVLVRDVFPRALLITPNLDEAALLLGHTLSRREDLLPAAQALQALGAPAVLLKGGHLQGDVVEDLLLERDGTVTRLASERIATRNGHGTGCTLSSAIAAHLALGLDLASAVRQGREFIVQAIAAGADVRTGQGHGPLNHGHAPRPMHVVDAGP